MNTMNNNNTNTMNTGGNSNMNSNAMDSESNREAINEKKLINKLIKNIENNLKINSSECCSSDNNSVYSDSSRNSKKATK